MPLSSVNEGQRVRIESLPLHPALQRRLEAMGIAPGVEVEVLRRGRPGGILHLACGLLEFMLRQEQAQEMDVSLLSRG
ncbi:FeoA domain superfamily [Cyanobium sp. PCC 7001]|nr:FeoA domain superfamily [Cyanobium sp. PCC 7001]